MVSLADGGRSSLLWCAAFVWCALQLSGDNLEAQQAVHLPALEVEPWFDGMVRVGEQKIHCKAYGDDEPAVLLISGSQVPGSIVGCIASRKICGWTGRGHANTDPKYPTQT